jgi:hypothetical protein
MRGNKMIIINDSLKRLIELEKDASLASTAGHVLLVGNTLLGGLGVGYGVGTISGASQSKQGFELSKQLPKVKSLDYIKQNAPNLTYANKDSLNKQNRFNKYQKQLLGTELDRGNLFYSRQTKNFKPQIIASDSAPQTLLLHELGHHKDFTQHPKWRPGLMREYSAWKNVPISSPGYKILKNKMLGSYERQVGGSIAGLLGGLLAGFKLSRKIRGK